MSAEVVNHLIDTTHPLFSAYSDFYQKLSAELGKSPDAVLCWTCFLAGTAAGADMVMKRVLGEKD